MAHPQCLIRNSLKVPCFQQPQDARQDARHMPLDPKVCKEGVLAVVGSGGHL